MQNNENNIKLFVKILYWTVHNIILNVAKCKLYYDTKIKNINIYQLFF